MGNKRILLVGVAFALTITSIVSYHLYGVLTPSQKQQALGAVGAINRAASDVAKINAIPSTDRLRALRESNELMTAVSNTLNAADENAVKANPAATAKVAELARSGLPFAGAAQTLEQKIKAPVGGGSGGGGPVVTDADKVEKVITNNKANITTWLTEIITHINSIKNKKTELENVLNDKEDVNVTQFKTDNKALTDQIEFYVNQYTNLHTDLTDALTALKNNSYQLEADQSNINEPIKTESHANNFVGSIQVAATNVKNDLKLSDIDGLINQAKNLTDKGLGGHVKTWQQIKMEAEATAQNALNIANGKGYVAGDTIYDDAMDAKNDAEAADDLTKANNAKDAADDALQAANIAVNKPIGPKKSLVELQQATANVLGKSQDEKDAVLADIEAQIQELENQNIYDGPDYEALDELKQQLVVKF